jgi:putative transposase
VETAAAVEIKQGCLRRYFLDDFHRCLKKSPQKTLRLFHSYHRPGGGYDNDINFSKRLRSTLNKPLFGPKNGEPLRIRQQLGRVFHALAEQKGCQIIEGHLMPDHVHMCIAIPPKHPVASVIGFLKGKSAIAIARLSGKERNFTGEHFWARGYAVSTVGFELEQIRKYIREQDGADGTGGQF